jgi:hypothetical protein
VKVAHESTNDISLNLNMVNIRKLLEKDNTFIDCFREKLKKINLFKGDGTTWLQIINNRTKGKDYYVDLDIELLQYFKETYSENMKKYIKKLNNDLSNIASYSIGYLSEDEAVKKYYMDNLKTSIESAELNDMAVRTALARNPPQKFFRLPFLANIYKKLQTEVAEKLLRDNKKEFDRLNQFLYNLKLADMHGTPEDKIKPIREKISQGEIFLKDLLSRVISPILEEISKKLGDINDKDTIKSYLIMDLMALSLDRIKIQKTEEILENYRVICAMIHSTAFTDPHDLFVTSSILTLSLDSQTKFVFEIMAISNFNAREIDEFRQKLEHEMKETKHFFFNYNSFDHLVNYCQERLIPEFDDVNLDLKLFKEKYEMVIKRITEDKKDIAENDPLIFNFKSLINLFSLLSILPQQYKLKFLARLKDIKNQKQRFGSTSSLDFIREEILTIFFESSDIRNINSSEFCLVLSEHISVNLVMLNFESVH